MIKTLSQILSILQIYIPAISIPYSSITRVEGMEEQRITKTRVFMTSTLTGLLWKKNYLYTVTDYTDENEEEEVTEALVYL